MWQVYPYGHAKLKLNKDLKTAEAHLRISLIDSEQIQNMNRIYNDRKDYYRIDSNSFSVPKYTEQEINQEATTHLSYKEKVELYRQRLQHEKMQNKYNNLFKKAEKRKYKMRKPVLYKMLQSFQQNHKHEDNIKVIEDLKESQKNLQMIKINTNRRANFKKASKNASMLQRPRFISLENGLPQKQSQELPDWKDFLQGKFQKTDQSAYYTNIFELQGKLDAISDNKTKLKKSNNTNTYTIFKQNTASSPLRDKTTSFSKTNYGPNEIIFKMEKQKQPSFSCQRCKEEPELKRHGFHNEQDNASRTKTFNTQIEIQRRKLYSRQVSKKTVTDQNVSKTAEKIFTKSQNCSKQVIATMSGFYQCKNNKKQDYKKMVYHLKNDRPLTSDIRRKNYRVIGEQNIPQVRKYRVHSQNQRVKLKQKNNLFYIELLQALSAHNIEQLPLSGTIMQRIKKILLSNYVINRDHYQYIVQPSLYEQRDVKSQYLLKKIQAFVGQK